MLDADLLIAECHSAWFEGSKSLRGAVKNKATRCPLVARRLVVKPYTLGILKCATLVGGLRRARGSSTPRRSLRELFEVQGLLRVGARPTSS
ncbi:hypothetical protein TNCT_149511 [Trichonephila clavata]|uniref:Uncharacterized protein n=1 Tax=Trichonephila clavata TaxID=2740835 RepID=A0A8X6IYA3_TRICU|nr:hypothetical protein TNCT_149511 [Trichonephila clavata]